MTTTATEKSAAKVDLTAANGQVTPKRRGRPPGSKNKTTATKTPRTRVAASKPLPTFVQKAAPVHAVLIEDGGVSVLHADGTHTVFNAPVFDRRTK